MGGWVYGTQGNGTWICRLMRGRGWCHGWACAGALCLRWLAAASRDLMQSLQRCFLTCLNHDREKNKPFVLPRVSQALTKNFDRDKRTPWPPITGNNGPFSSLSCFVYFDFPVQLLLAAAHSLAHAVGLCLALPCAGLLIRSEWLRPVPATSVTQASLDSFFATETCPRAFGSSECQDPSFWSLVSHRP